MNYRLQFRRYRLPFRAAVRTAHGVWREREGLIVRLEDKSESGGGAIGWGEAAPIPEFGTETVDEAEAGVRALGEWIEGAKCEEVPERLGCLRNAIASARAEIELGRVSDSPSKTEGVPGRVGDSPYLGVAALLPAGRAVLEAIPPRAELGCGGC